MKQRVGRVAVVVPCYDEAIEFYTQKLEFTVKEDVFLGDGKRWVTIVPPGDERGCEILLAQADNDDQKCAIGNQAGGRVFLFLFTDNFQRDYRKMREKGVQFNEEPRHEPYGIVAVFQDCFGNLWDLIQNI